MKPYKLKLNQETLQRMNEAGQPGARGGHSVYTPADPLCFPIKP